LQADYFSVTNDIENHQDQKRHFALLDLCHSIAVGLRREEKTNSTKIADFHQRRKYPCLSRVFENSALFSHLQKTTCLLPYSNVLSRSFPNRICMRNLVQYIVVVLHLGPRSTWDVSSSGHTTLQNSLVQFSSLSEGALKKKKLKAKERAFFFTEAPEYSS